MSFADRLVARWYAPRLSPLTLALTPATALFAAVSAVRRTLYRRRILAVERVAVPVVVVGNITAGGSGKTPLAIALAQALAAGGRRPGIVSRGYGRTSASASPLDVRADTDPNLAGDEPVLIARAGFSVVVAADRVAAVRALLAAHPDCDVVIADDGLQHYRLARDVEIAVVDASRRFGNGWRLPAGPLREAPTRLAAVDAVVVLTDDPAQAQSIAPGAFAMTLSGDTLHRVNAPDATVPASRFRGERVHAVAGIGNPERFFAQLRALGIDAQPHAFPDHHRFVAADLAFARAAPILMTEKDAVKCAAFAREHCWYLPVRAHLDPALVARVLEKIRGSEAA